VEESSSHGGARDTEVRELPESTPIEQI
jgi:hypothetical protein